MRGLRGGMSVRSFGTFRIGTLDQTGIVHPLPELRNLLPGGCTENARESRVHSAQEEQVVNRRPSDEGPTGVSSFSLTLMLS